MTAYRPPAPVELIPAMRQRLWRAPAVLNFALGGLGAGFYLVAAVAARLEMAPALVTAAWLGPLLVLAGFAAVTTEAGRPLRGPRVLVRVATSWMSREAALGGAFAATAALEFLAPAPGLRLLAAILALAFVTAQGFIVRRARGIAAWDVSVMPPLFVVSALVSGLGLLLVVEPALGRAPRGDVPGVTLVVVAVALLVWLAYLTWSPEPAFVRATRALRERAPGALLVGGGYVAPFALLAVARTLGDSASLAALAAGALLVGGQAWAKWLVILTAGEFRPITLASLRLHRRPS